MRALVLALALWSCAKKKHPPEQHAPSSGEAALCLADAGARPSAVDGEIKKQQQQARALPDKPSAWVQVARAFIRKAQATTDSQLYSDASACITVALRLEPRNLEALGLQTLVLL